MAAGSPLSRIMSPCPTSTHSFAKHFVEKAPIRFSWHSVAVYSWGEEENWNKRRIFTKFLNDTTYLFTSVECTRQVHHNGFLQQVTACFWLGQWSVLVTDGENLKGCLPNSQKPEMYLNFHLTAFMIYYLAGSKIKSPIFTITIDQAIR